MELGSFGYSPKNLGVCILRGHDHNFFPHCFPASSDGNTRVPIEMNPFFRQARADAAWHPVGLASTFPDLVDHDGYRMAPKCRAFSIPKKAGPSDPKVPEEADIDLPGDLKDQVLVFKYKGNFHAVDHVSR